MYTMKEACQQVGISYETLRFYCNEGLVPDVKRDKNNPMSRETRITTGTLMKGTSSG